MSLVLKNVQGWTLYWNSYDLSSFFQLSADNKLKMSQARDGNLELELMDVKPVDTGKYSCTVTTATGDNITTTGNLTVTGW